MKKLAIVILFLYGCSKDHNCVTSERRAYLQKEIKVYERKYDSIYHHEYFKNQFYILDLTADTLHNLLVEEQKLRSVECP